MDYADGRDLASQRTNPGLLMDTHVSHSLYSLGISQTFGCLCRAPSQSDISAQRGQGHLWGL